MSITIKDKPEELGLVYNENVIVLTSTNSSKERFKMKFDVKIDGTTQSSFYLPTNLDGYIVADVHDHLTPWISNKIETTVTDFIFQKDEDSYNRYNISLSESFVAAPTFSTVSDSGGYSQYSFLYPHGFSLDDRVNVTDSLNLDGSQKVTSVVSTSILVTDKVYIANDSGTMKFADGRSTVTYIQDTYPNDYKFFNGVKTLEDNENYSVSEYETQIKLGGEGKLITTLPSIVNCDIDDIFYTNFYNLNTDVDYTIKYLRVTSDNGVFKINNPFSATNDKTSEFLKIGIGPYNLQNANPFTVTVVSGTLPIIDSNTTSYTCYLTNYLDVRASEDITFNIKDNCTLFDNYLFCYINKLGSMSSIRTTLNNKKMLNIKRTGFDQKYGEIIGDNYIVTSNSRGSKDIINNIDYKYKVDTNYLENDENDRLIELLYSNDVYTYENSKFYSVNILTNSVEYKKRLDGLIQYSFDFKYSKKYPVQKF